MEALLDAILLMGIGLSFVFFSAAVSNRPFRGQPVLFAALYFAIFWVQLSIWNVGAGLDLKLTHLAEIDQPFLLVLGPLLWFLQRELFQLDSLEPDEKTTAAEVPLFSKKDLVHFIPLVVVLGILTPFYSLDTAAKAVVMKDLFLTDLSELKDIHIAFACGLASVFGYSVAIGYRMRFVLNPAAIKKEPLIGVLFFVICSVFLIYGFLFTGIFSQNYLWIKACVAVLFFTQALIFVLTVRDSSLFQRAQQAVAKIRYRRKLDSIIDVGDTGGILRKLMNEEFLYRNDELNLKSLAEKVGITPHQLSQYLNEIESKNFNQYINSFRVSEAKTLLLEDAERSALSVAYQVGFNNYTTFQTAFRKETGFSPGRFRDAN